MLSDMSSLIEGNAASEEIGVASLEAPQTNAETRHYGHNHHELQVVVEDDSDDAHSALMTSSKASYASLKGSSCSAARPLQKPTECSQSHNSEGGLRRMSRRMSRRISLRLPRSSGMKRWSFLRHRVHSFGLHDHPDENEKKGRKRKLHRFVVMREAIDLKLWECVLAIIAYLLVGAICYSFLFEHWAIVDSLYFSVVTFTTVGYGDLYPETAPGRLFTCVFALGGICFLGVALGVIGNNLIAAEVAAMERARGKNRQKLISYFDRLPSSESMTSSRSSNGETNENAFESNSSHTKENQGVKSWLEQHLYPFVKFFPIILTILLGSLIFLCVERWTLVDAVYYCVVTAATIGYGDVNPDSTAMRWYALIFIPIAVGVMGVMIGGVAELVISKRKKKALEQIINHDITLEDLRMMDARGDGTVSKSEYLEFMLVAMNLVDRDLLKKLRTQFDRMDVDSDGFLARRDLELLAAKRRKELRHKLQLASYKYKLTFSGTKVATCENTLKEAADFSSPIRNC